NDRYGQAFGLDSTVCFVTLCQLGDVGRKSRGRGFELKNQESNSKNQEPNPSFKPACFIGIWFFGSSSLGGSNAEVSDRGGDVRSHGERNERGGSRTD